MRYLVRREAAYLLIAATGVLLGLRTNHAAASKFFAFFDTLRHQLGL
jgi:hypothetical protein